MYFEFLYLSYGNVFDHADDSSKVYGYLDAYLFLLLYELKPQLDKECQLDLEDLDCYQSTYINKIRLSAGSNWGKVKVVLYPTLLTPRNVKKNIITITFASLCFRPYICFPKLIKISLTLSGSQDLSRFLTGSPK